VAEVLFDELARVDEGFAGDVVDVAEDVVWSNSGRLGHGPGVATGCWLPRTIGPSWSGLIALLRTAGSLAQVGRPSSSPTTIGAKLAPQS
jgi:hypothetical protein